ncbi:hypothetical protein OIU77_023462, partial [Salix suchowensis]
METLPPPTILSINLYTSC